MAGIATDRIYLDHNATTPIFPEVVEAMRACWNAPYLNPASQHEFGRRARRILEDARDRIAELLGANTSRTTPDRVIFTSGGTEANNLAIRGLLPFPPGEGRSEAASRSHLIISPIEHPSITAVADDLTRHGCHVDRLRVEHTGAIRVDDLPNLLRPETRVVAVMLANNETGVLQPVAKFAAVCNERGVPLHADAAQAAAKLPLSFHKLNVATMSIAAHKFGGPLGIGALVVRHDVKIQPQLFGGFQQNGVRPGTESVPLVVGMLRALELWNDHRSEWLYRLASLRNEFEASMGRLASCGPVVIGTADRLPNTSNIAFVGLDRQQLFLALDQAGVACSTGSACASGSSEASPAHVAMGCEQSLISSALRFSFGVQSTPEQVAEATRRIIQVCNNLRR